MSKLKLDTDNQSTTNTFPKMREMFKEIYNKRKIKDSTRKPYKPKEIK